MKEYKIEVLYTKKINDEIPLIEVFFARIDEDNLISFNNYRFMYFKKLKNEKNIDFIKRTVKTLLLKNKYKFINDIRVTEQ